MADLLAAGVTGAMSEPDRGPPGRRRGPLRGLPALPVHGRRDEEPAALAVRGAGPAGCRPARRRGAAAAGRRLPGAARARRHAAGPPAGPAAGHAHGRGARRRGAGDRCRSCAPGAAPGPRSRTGAEVELPTIVQVERLAGGVVVPLSVPGGRDCEELDSAEPDGAGGPVGRVVRTPASRSPRSCGCGRHRSTGCCGSPSRWRTRRPPSARAGTPRRRASLLGAHVLLAADGARFVSLLDPPAELRRGRGRLRPAPLLAGAGRPARGRRRAAGQPDHPVRPPGAGPAERGALFDATEIDEILTLRVMTLTDEEKAAARATDPRAAADRRPLRGAHPRRDGAAARRPARPGRPLHAAPDDPRRGPRTRGTGRGGTRRWTARSTRTGRRCSSRGVPVQQGQPRPRAPEPPGRRPGPVLRRPGGPGDRGARRRRRRHARRRGPGRRPRRRPARVVRAATCYFAPDELEPAAARRGGRRGGADADRRSGHDRAAAGRGDGRSGCWPSARCPTSAAT